MLRSRERRGKRNPEGFNVYSQILIKRFDPEGVAEWVAITFRDQYRITILTNLEIGHVVNSNPYLVFRNAIIF